MRQPILVSAVTCSLVSTPSVITERPSVFERSIMLFSLDILRCILSDFVVLKNPMSILSTSTSISFKVFKDE